MWRIFFLIAGGAALLLGAWWSAGSASARSTANPASPQYTVTPAPYPPPVEPLPPGAQIETVLNLPVFPLDMVFDPDGRLFYTEYSGAVRLVVNGMLQPATVIQLSGQTRGIALDPAFATNHYVYVFLLGHSVIRFTEVQGVGQNPTTIFQVPGCTSCDHAGGGLAFGPDGKLYISVGDNGVNTTAQDVTDPHGKIHRINSDGTIPPDNPVFTGTGALPSLYVRGLRNSVGLTNDPLSANLFASENGPNCDDEVNRIVGGYNYGWGLSGLPCNQINIDPTYNSIPPLWYLPSPSCCTAPVGIEVYRGTNLAAWQNDLFMMNYQRATMFHYHMSIVDRSQVLSVTTVAGTGMGTAVETGPDGGLYFFTHSGNQWMLQRIIGPSPTPTETPGPPSATPTATDTPLLPTATDTPLPPTAPATSTPCALQFSDVDPNNVFWSYIRCLACRGIVSGYADGTFRWQNPVTRGQVAKIVVGAAGFGDLIPPTQQTFSDVPPSQPFWLWIERLVAHGAISGYTCGGPGEPCDGQNRPYFRPGNDVTRGQLAKIDAIAAGYQEAIPTTQQTFTDTPPANPFWIYAERVYTHAMMSGYDCGGPGEPCCPTCLLYFRPGGQATRGQMAKVGARTFYPNCQP